MTSSQTPRYGPLAVTPSTQSGEGDNDLRRRVTTVGIPGDLRIRRNGKRSDLGVVVSHVVVVRRRRLGSILGSSLHRRLASNQQARSNSMPLCDALTTRPNHSPSGRVTVSPGAQPDPDGPSGWVVDGGVPVVTTVVVEVVDEVDGTVVEVASEVTVRSGVVVSDTPLDPPHAVTKTSDITPACKSPTHGIQPNRAKKSIMASNAVLLLDEQCPKVANPPIHCEQPSKYDVGGTVHWEPHVPDCRSPIPASRPLHGVAGSGGASESWRTCLVHKGEAPVRDLRRPPSRRPCRLLVRGTGRGATNTH